MKRAIATTAWVIGLCMAGATGPIYINFLGVGVFLLATRMIVKEAEHG